MARRSLLGVVVALALCCSACAVDATVTVKVREDGSGLVRVDVVADAEAVQTAEVGGGTLEDRVRLADLPAAGWAVEPWVRNEDGSASVQLSKPFTSVDQVPGILEELSGTNGPVRDPSFTRSRSFFATRFAADATVDLGAITTGITEDPDLVARLQAQGVDVGGVDQQLLGQLRDAFTFTFVVDLPGAGKTTVTPAAGASRTFSASASLPDERRITLVVTAALLVLFAVVVALWPRKKGRHRRHHRRRRRQRRRNGRGPVSSGEAPLSWEDATSPTRRGTPPAS